MLAASLQEVSNNLLMYSMSIFDCPYTRVKSPCRHLGSLPYEAPIIYPPCHADHGAHCGCFTADLTGLVDMLKDWSSLHQQQTMQGPPMPVFDRQSLQPVCLASNDVYRPPTQSAKGQRVKSELSCAGTQGQQTQATHVYLAAFRSGQCIPGCVLPAFVGGSILYTSPDSSCHPLGNAARLQGLS